MQTKRFATIALFVGFVGITFEILQIVLYDSHLSMEWCYTLNRWNHLVYFTVITNLIVDFWLISVGIAVFSRRKDSPTGAFYKFLTKPQIQGAIVLYISIVGLIYCSFLYWFIGAYSAELWWANVIDLWNHFIIPLAVITLWFLTPHKERLKWITLLWWLVLPLIYFAVSLARGLIFDWYPYPFFRPSKVLFPVGISITIACFLVLGSVIILLHNNKCKRARS